MLPILRTNFLPFLEVLKSAARMEQLARAAAPATQATSAASASVGRSGSAARASSDMASAVRDCVGINDSGLAPAASPAFSAVPRCFFFQK